MNLPELKLCFNHLYQRVNPLHALHGLLLAVWPQPDEPAQLLVANPAPEAPQHLHGHLTVDGLALATGQLRPRVTPVTADMALEAEVHQVLLLAATQPLTLTLPVAAPVGTTFVLKDAASTADTHPTTLEAGGAETVDGQAFIVLDVPYERVTVMATGTGWVLL
jgi:hypothetical protein